jgi:very-short-patch-repair endonuclease
VQRVVELVVEHARTRPNETLGVIAMGMTHAKRIEMEFERVRQLFPELDGFFAQNRSERFFIKNLERVQGDERDAIILSVGYGKNEAGKLVYRFGPLNQDGGERRLNVAITRARRRMTVVSSFSHHDVDPTYPREGVKHLRNYLEYAATGGKSFGLTGGAESVPLNEFEQAIHDELTRRGLRLLSQVGSSNYRIDLVAVHPEKPGRFVLAIECDGASYHSAPSARDRDRLRQQQLEAIGWKFCRIWSTDWFLRREEEVQRVLAAFEKARRQVDAEDAGREGMMVNADRLTIAPPTVSQSPAQRGPMPRLSGRPNISNYAIGELVTMVRWVASDGRLRTDEELLAETVEALGFARRGSRIVERVSDAIRLLKSLPDWPA